MLIEFLLIDLFLNTRIFNWRPTSPLIPACTAYPAWQRLHHSTAAFSNEHVCNKYVKHEIFIHVQLSNLISSLMQRHIFTKATRCAWKFSIISYAAQHSDIARKHSPFTINKYKTHTDRLHKRSFKWKRNHATPPTDSSRAHRRKIIQKKKKSEAAKK